MLNKNLIFVVIFIVQNMIIIPSNGEGIIIPSNDEGVDRQFTNFLETVSAPKTEKTKKNFRPQSFSFKLFATQTLISFVVFGGAGADIWINHAVPSGPSTIALGVSACNCFFSVWCMLKTYRWKKPIIIQQQ